MTKHSKNSIMRESTEIRYNHVHKLYSAFIRELGELSAVVSKNYLYGKIKERTGLSIRTISFILNHTKPAEGK